MVMLVILSEAKDLTIVREVPYFARNDAWWHPHLRSEPNSQNIAHGF